MVSFEPGPKVLRAGEKERFSQSWFHLRLFSTRVNGHKANVLGNAFTLILCQGQGGAYRMASFRSDRVLLAEHGNKRRARRQTGTAMASHPRADCGRRNLHGITERIGSGPDLVAASSHLGLACADGI